MGIALRPYQSEAVIAMWDYLRTQPGNPLVVLPTGAGKTIVIAEACRAVVNDWQGQIMVLAHTKELLRQGMDKVASYAPELNVGAYSAGLGRKDRFAPVIFGGIQSVAKKAHSFPPPDILMIDEAHRVPLKNEGLYRRFISDLQRYKPSMRVIGLSATPYRLQGSAVPVCGEDFVFQDICYEARIPDLIADGYLSPLTSKAGVTPDLSNVHIRNGDYVESEMAAAFMPLVERTVDDLLERSIGRRAGIIFCASVEHAEAVVECLRSRGETARAVHGGTKKAERDAAIQDYANHQFRWIVNVNVLTEGFDAPHIDVVAMMRATKSVGLYYQMCGRGLRLFEGKLNCLVLDYAGNTLTHGPIDQIRVSRRFKTFGETEVKTGRSKQCPECDALMPNGARICAECEYVFSVGEIDHYDQAIEAPVLSSEGERVIRTAEVRSVTYKPHVSKNGNQCLRVNYNLGLRSISEWVTFEGAGRYHGQKWWIRMGGGTMPESALEGLRLAELGALRKPEKIVFDDTDKLVKVLDYEFGESGGNEIAKRVALAQSGGEVGGGVSRAETAAIPTSVPGLQGLPEWMVRALGG